MLNSITILSAADVNRTKWDNCIKQHENGLIYSTSDYLDAMCDDWDGLIINNYEAVMALPWRKKWGIKYFYKPALAQQHGLIGKLKIDAAELIEQISCFARYGDIHFNYTNKWLADTLKLHEKTNLVLNLGTDYEAIRRGYRQDLSDNLRKAQQKKLRYCNKPDIDLAISFFEKHYHQRIGTLRGQDYNKFNSLCKLLYEQGKCFTRQMLTEDNQILSIGLFLVDDKRIYNMMNTTTREGRKLSANHLLLDGVIREYSGQQLLFDFEGSDVTGVKSFYEKFGTFNQPYFHYHHNRLPLILRWIKR